LKLLLDTCVWGGAVESLSALGHDVFWSGNINPDPGDTEILSKALLEQRILVTLDKDFGELVFLHGHKHAGMIRLVEVPSLLQAQVISMLICDYGELLASGAIITLKNDKVRVRRPLTRMGI